MKEDEIEDITLRRISALSPAKRLLLEMKRGKKGEIPRITRHEYVPLSFAQERLWILDQLEPRSSAYNTCTAFRLEGPLDVSRLRRSLDELVRRHEVLRTTFREKDGDPVQVIAGSGDIDLAYRDFRKLATDTREPAAFSLINEDMQKPFDLEKGPLLRAHLLHLGKRKFILSFVIHHIIFDGWSEGVMSRELSEIYNAFAEGKPSPLPPLPLQYADFSVWQRNQLRGEVLESQLSYWKESLRDVPPVLEIAGARPRNEIATSPAATQPVELSRDLTAALSSLSRREGVTLFMTLLAAFKMLLHRYTGREDIVVGSPVANRNRVEIEDMIGFFANTLVLRTDLSGSPTFRGLLSRVREVALGAYAHQDLPFEKLVEELQPERNPGYNPIFQFMFVLQNTPAQPMTLSDISAAPLAFLSDAARFDLTLSLTETEEKICGFIKYHTGLFDPDTIARMAGHFRVLLEGAVADPDGTIAAMPLCTEAERADLLSFATGRRTPYPRDRCLHEIFETQVKVAPENVAVAGEEGSLTYKTLNRRANRLARFLGSMGVGPEVRVGIFMDSSPEMVVAVLSVLKAGGAYVPIDPFFPGDRVSFIIRDSGMAVLLTRTALKDKIADCPAKVFCMEDPEETLAAYEDSNPVNCAAVENQAYVLYTSGSTGQPKGVVVEQRQLLNYMQGIMEQTGMRPGESYAMVQPLAVDSCKTVLYPPLCSGGTLHVLPRDRAMDPAAVADYFRRHPIDVLKIAPSHLAALVDSSRGSEVLPRHLLIVGGESSSPEFMEKLAELAPATTVFNHYGPTEATVGVATYKVARSFLRRAKTVPLGRPLPNTQVYLLDKAMQPVPLHVPGEIWIGGAGIARGYLNRPELTSEKFIGDIFTGSDGSRLYRTGDLAYRLADGNIVYLGRMDAQIKVRGFRIEPGEIEAAIRQHPDSPDALVTVRDRPRGGGKSLVAYLVPRSRVPLIREMRDFLRQRLPDYMVPEAFAVLEEFPLTRHGKVDLNALPEPERTDDEPVRERVAPQSREEEAVARVWKEVLGVEQIGIHDNFFAIGGHSLLATKVISRLRLLFGPDLPLRSIFENPTIAGLSGSVTPKRGAVRETPRDAAVEKRREEER
jgi:surfactin family lipopeptide synthetase A